MKRIKDWVFTTFGTIGVVLFYLVSILFQIAPLIMLDFHFLIDFVLIIAMICIPFLNIIVNLIVWIWALIVTIGGEQDAWAIAYYIIFAINAFSVLLRLFDAYAQAKRQ